MLLFLTRSTRWCSYLEGGDGVWLLPLAAKFLKAAPHEGVQQQTLAVGLCCPRLTLSLSTYPRQQLQGEARQLSKLSHHLVKGDLNNIMLALVSQKGSLLSINNGLFNMVSMQ